MRVVLLDDPHPPWVVPHLATCARKRYYIARDSQCRGANACGEPCETEALQMARPMVKGRKTAWLAVLAATTLVAATACGGDSNSGDQANAGATSHGPITFVTGKDNSDVWRPTIDKWNSAHPTEKVTLKEQTDKADQQHDDIVQHIQAKDASYDMVTVDVIWTAEFAAKGWLTPLKDKIALDTSALLKPTVDAATYNGTLYAAPFATDGGCSTTARTWSPARRRRSTRCGRLLDRQAERHGLLRRPVRQVRRPDGERRRGDQHLRRQDRRRDGQGRPSTAPSPSAGLQTLVDALQER